MANTIDWGQGAVNNTIDWGKGKTNNTINWGAIYDSTAAGETNITGSGGVAPFVNTYSMSFDGIDERFYVGTSSLGITNAITVSAWVKIPTTNTGGGSIPYIQNIVCEDNTNAGQRNWNLYWRGTGFNHFGWAIHHTNLSVSAVTSIGVVPNDNQWHHLLGTFDGTTNANGMKLYIDGVLNNQTTALSTGINSYTSTEATIGALTGGVNWRFEGNIDEVAIWDSDQNTNAATIYNSGTPADLTSLSPLSWWRMGDGDTWGGSSWTLTDQGSGGNNATSVFMEEADRLPISPNSYSQYSFNFNFNSTFNLATKTQNFTDFSLSFWILSRGGNNKTLFSNDSLTVANGGGILANIQDSAYRVRYFDDSTGYTNLSDTLIGFVWNHVVITYQSSINELKGYTNNVLFTTLNPTITTFANNSHSFDKIGYSVGSNYTGSNLDEISVFDSVLNPTQISQIFGIGTPNDISSLSPIHHWRMGENATWNGSQWTITDIGSSPITLTSNGMTEAYRTGDQPYVI